MVVRQRDVWWANLREPIGSEAGFRRPVVVVQGDGMNRSRVATVVVIPLTGNLRLARLPGNVMVVAADANLPRDSVANVSQVTTIDRSQLDEFVGQIPPHTLSSIFSGIDLVLDR